MNDAVCGLYYFSNNNTVIIIIIALFALFQMESKRLKTEREHDDLKQNVEENLTAVARNSIKADAPFTKLRPKAPSSMSYTVSIFRVLCQLVLGNFSFEVTLN